MVVHKKDWKMTKTKLYNAGHYVTSTLGLRCKNWNYNKDNDDDNSDVNVT